MPEHRITTLLPMTWTRPHSPGVCCARVVSVVMASSLPGGDGETAPAFVSVFRGVQAQDGAPGIAMEAGAPAREGVEQAQDAGLGPAIGAEPAAEHDGGGPQTLALGAGSGFPLAVVGGVVAVTLGDGETLQGRSGREQLTAHVDREAFTGAADEEVFAFGLVGHGPCLLTCWVMDGRPGACNPGAALPGR